MTSLTLPVYRFLVQYIKQSTVPISFSFQPQGQTDIPLPSPLETDVYRFVCIASSACRSLHSVLFDRKTVQMSVSHWR
jgi:hypothetical protein